MLRFGPMDGPVVVVALPLFEEANRVRALLVAVLRHLAERGIGGALPDLPGQGESLVSLVDVQLSDWREAFAAAVESAGPRSYVVASRGGALVTEASLAAGQLHFAPATGRTLARDLMRARRAASMVADERPVADDIDLPGPPLLLAGNPVSRDMLRALMAAQPGPADRVLRLYPDQEHADGLLAPDEAPNRDGDVPRYKRPWTASEPCTDTLLTGALATDIAQWVRACEDC